MHLFVQEIQEAKLDGDTDETPVKPPLARAANKGTTACRTLSPWFLRNTFHIDHLNTFTWIHFVDFSKDFEMITTLSH